MERLLIWMNTPYELIHLFIRQFWRILKIGYLRRIIRPSVKTANNGPAILRNFHPKKFHTWWNSNKLSKDLAPTWWEFACDHFWL